MKTKKCSKCGETKDISEFYKDKKGSDNLSCWCKECTKINSNQNHKDNRDERLKYQKQYRENNKEKLAKQQKEWGLNNKEKIKMAQSNWYLKNKERVLEKAKIYYIKNIEKILEYNENNKEKIQQAIKHWQDKNKEYIKEQSRKYNKNRKKTDIAFKILINLRSRIHQALKNNTKSKRTLEFLGCTPEELKNHLESQFTNGMSWDNYGRGDNGLKEWHIDHIKPCAKFDLTDPKQQELCFHYTNLQPLWAIDNLKKGATFNV